MTASDIVFVLGAVGLLAAQLLGIVMLLRSDRVLRRAEERERIREERRQDGA